MTLDKHALLKSLFAERLNKKLEFLEQRDDREQYYLKYCKESSSKIESHIDKCIKLKILIDVQAKKDREKADRSKSNTRNISNDKKAQYPKSLSKTRTEIDLKRRKLSKERYRTNRT